MSNGISPAMRELQIKYEKLLKFVKGQAQGGKCCQDCICEDAQYLLKEMGVTDE